MGSRLLLNLGLVILLAGLALIVIFEPGIEQAPPPGILTTIERDSVTRIELERKDKPGILLERSQEYWTLHREIPLRAADFKLETLLGILNQKWTRKYATADLATDNVGLNDPEAIIRYNNTSEIKFGSTDALEGHRYIGIGDDIYMVTDNVLPLIKGQWTSFVSPRLFPENTTVTSIKSPDFSVHNVNGRWQLEPDNENVSADSITVLAGAWKHATALWVAEMTGGKSKKQVQVSIANRTEPIVFSILETEPELILGRDDLKLQYILSGDATKNLLQLSAPEIETVSQENK